MSLPDSPQVQGLGYITLILLQQLMGCSMRESATSRRNQLDNGIDRISPILWVLWLLFSQSVHHGVEEHVFILDRRRDPWQLDVLQIHTGKILPVHTTTSGV